MSSKKISKSIEKFRMGILNEELPYGHMLPPETELAETLQLSRPTVAKIYDALKDEGLVQKRQGFGTSVIYKKDKKKFSFGLLFPGSSESEIFGKISDHFLTIESSNNVKFLWDGAIANNAQIRKNTILNTCQNYIDNGVDGIFFAPLERIDKANTLNMKICELVDRFNIPLVLLDRDVCKFPERSSHTVVGLDNYSAGYLMTQHLIDNGCENIYFLCRRDSANSVYKRIVGCGSSCFDSKIKFDQNNIVIGDPSDPELLQKINIVSGKTGILCANDSTAAALMSSIDRLGIVISKDILLAGFDDMKYAKVLQMPLTTYRQPLSDIVTLAYEIMLNRISNNKKFKLNLDVEGKIIVRKSTSFIV